MREIRCFRAAFARIGFGRPPCFCPWADRVRIAGDLLPGLSITMIPTTHW